MTKFCLKCRHWRATESSSGQGRQYRCASCSSKRREGNQKRQLRSTFMRAIKDAIREAA